MKKVIVYKNMEKLNCWREKIQPPSPDIQWLLSQYVTVLL